jgi:hypothetical protein
MTAWILFGVEEGGAGTGAGAFGGIDVAVSAGGALAGGGAASAGAIRATASDPRALGGEVFGLGEISAVGGTGQRETNSSLEPALAIDVWLKSLGRSSP